MRFSNYLKATLMAALFTVMALSCTKSGSVSTPVAVTADATIIDEGPIESDGCGWMLKIDSNYYSPTNLPDKYKTTNSKVTVTYILLTTKFQCGLAANLRTPQIEIKSVTLK